MTTRINKPKSKYKKCSFSDPFIYIEDGTLSKKFCKKVIAKFEKDDKEANWEKRTIFKETRNHYEIKTQTEKL